jgi:hypothetical protein
LDPIHQVSWGMSLPDLLKFAQHGGRKVDVMAL